MPITNLSQYGYIKSPARTVATSNVTISSPGSSVGGATLSSGDANKRVLLAGQTSASENGLYDWNGASSAMTRCVDANLSAMFIPGFVVAVLDGTSAGAVYQYQGAASPTLGSTSLTFTRTNPAATTPTITVKDIDGTPSIAATTIEFTNGTVTDQAGGVARVTISASGSVTVKEEDGTPSVTATEIKFPNGSLTDNGGGSVSVAFSGGSAVGNEYNPFQTLVSPSASNQALTSSGGTALAIRGGDTESFGATGYSITTASNGGVSSLRGRYYTLTLPNGGFVCVYLNRPTCGSFSNAAFALMHTYASGASSGFSALVFNQDNNVLLEGYTSSTANTGPIGTAQAVIVPSGYPRIWLGWERQGLDYVPWRSYDGVCWTPYGSKVTLGSAADGIFVGTNSYSNTVAATWKSIRVFAAIGPAGGV